MAGQLAIDITDEAVSGERFPARLRELGLRLMQAIDVGGRPLHQYVIPPTVEVPAGQFLMGAIGKMLTRSATNFLPIR